MPARFDDWIPYFRDPKADPNDPERLDDVVAIGPLHEHDELKEVCAWIYQPTSVVGSDAAATEMHFENGHGHPQPGAALDPLHHSGTEHVPDFQQDKGKRWLLPLKRISEAEFEPGPAFAVAIALVVDMRPPHKQRVVWWGQPVDLFENKVRVLAAREHDALLSDPLKTPAKGPSTD
jgi:hypothetical protein